MIQVLHVTNPFQPTEGLLRTEAFAGQTIRQWLQFHFGAGFEEFDVPTICQVNGEYVLRPEWDHRVLNDGDQLVFVTVPGEVVTIVIAIIAVVVAVAAYLLIPDPAIPNDETKSSNPSYTLRGQTNRLRPGDPIEVVYGKCRIWPTFIARPYSRYKGNQQYQYSLFCVGQGHYELSSLRLDDTNIGSFDEVEYEIVEPGDIVSLVEAAVYHALEVSNIELLGPNEEDYTGVSGPFVLNEFDNPIHRIEHDISFPQGLYQMSKKGKLEANSVELLFEHQEIDASGSPIGAWETTMNPTIERSDNTPQRITLTQSVSPGRYRIRARRVSEKPDSTRNISQVRWETAKGYARFKKSFGNVTVVAVKALATNKLNDQTSKAFNLIAHRKLKTWTAEDGWSEDRVTTRNPIWAFCDLFRSKYGARITTEYLDMPTLADLAQTLEEKSNWFDWVFDSQITVWEAAQTILRVGRCVPIPQGSLITAVRDRNQSSPSAFFNAYNIVKGTLTKKLSLFEFNPFDSLIVEYTNPTTWKTEEVTCVLPGGTSDNPDRLKLPGCTNRNRAYREGLYILSRRMLQRKTVTFQTGMEGLIPTHLDLIAITHDTVRVGQGGFILAYNSSTKEMTLSEQVEFASDNLEHRIAIRQSDGSIAGSAITCTPGSAANKVILATHPSETLDFSIDQVPPLFAFGVADLWTFRAKVISVKPVDSRTVEITAVNYVDNSYIYDDYETTDAEEVAVIKDPSSPQVSTVTIGAVPNNDQRVYVDWPPVPGAAGYLIETTYDDVNWSPAGSVPNPPVQLSVNRGTLRVKVAPFAINGNVIYTQSNLFVVGSNLPVPPRPVSTTQDPFIGLTATAKWIGVADADLYLVEVWIVGGVAALREIEAGAGTSVSYTRAQFETDSPSENSRSLEFHIIAVNAGGESDALVIRQDNVLPEAPYSLVAGAPTGSNYPVSWTHSVPEDFATFKVYVSDTMGFTPGPGNLQEETTSLGVIVNAPTTRYVRVSALDVWGDEESMSDELQVN